MKGSAEYKRYVSKHRIALKRIRWDDLLLFKLERCVKKFKRIKRLTKHELAEVSDDQN